MTKILIAVVVIALLAIAGFILFSGNDEVAINDVDKTEDQPPAAVEDKTSYTIEDVSLHDNRNDCWIVLHGGVYDVTAFIKSHPGKDAILEGCGTDATELFESRPMGSATPHSSKARNLLPDLFIGELKNESVSVPIESEYDGKVVYTTNASYDVALLEADCSGRGGVFNTCGSVCEPGAEMCADVCAFTCEY